MKAEEDGNKFSDGTQPSNETVWNDLEYHIQERIR